MFVKPTIDQMMNRMVTLAIVDQVQRCMACDTTGEDIEENYTFQYVVQMRLINPGIINVARRFLLEIEQHEESVVENYLDNISQATISKNRDSEKKEMQPITNLYEDEKECEKESDEEDNGSYEQQLCSAFGLLANLED